MRHYCTYFDSGYLTRGLALIQSLRAIGEPFRLFVLCMDTASEQALRALAIPDLTLIALADLEAMDPPLAAAKKNRTRLEFYYTCSPVLPLHVLEHHPEIDQIVYLDADLYFFASPEPIFREIGSTSVAIISHRFGEELAHHNVYGKYNVGFLAFRRTPTGIGCLRWWRERTLEWCRTEFDGDRFADQKYLDQWPAMFADLVEIANEGANVAPWNVGRFPIEVREGRVHFKNVPLVFYHFHGVKKLAPGIFDPQLARYGVPVSRSLRTLLYGPYFGALERAEASLQEVAKAPSDRAGRFRLPTLGGGSWKDTFLKLRSDASTVLRGMHRRELIYFLAGRVL